MRSGIAVAGNMVVDLIKTIAAYPRQSELAKIASVEYSFGGAVNNTLRALARLDPTLPLTAAGLIGEDDYGEAMLRELAKYPSIDTSLIAREGMSSFCDVMAETTGGKARTFFYYAGANAKFAPRHVPLYKLNCKILHAGYILLLDAMDAPDAECGTKLARLLRDAQAMGMRTSVDVVSESSDRFGKLVPPSLKYADYAIINELEAEKTTGVKLRRDDGSLALEAMPEALAALKAMGVKRWAVVHAVEGGFGMDENGEYVACPGALPPEGYIVGTVGAGDAFCAGVLRAACLDEPLRCALEEGVAASVASLSASGPVDGIPEISEALRALSLMSRRSL